MLDRELDHVKGSPKHNDEKKSRGSESTNKIKEFDVDPFQPAVTVQQ